MWNYVEVAKVQRVSFLQKPNDDCDACVSACDTSTEMVVINFYVGAMDCGCGFYLVSLR